MIGAVGYARVSTRRTKRGAEQQLSLPRRRKSSLIASSMAFSLLNVFEASESARTIERPVFQEALKYCRQNTANLSYFIVSDLSRLARNVQDQAQIFVVMNQLGIKLVALDDPITDDSAVGKLSRNMIGMVNQFFSDSLSERTRQRMQGAVKAGRFPWPAPIGYRNVDKELKLDSERAPLIREAFEMVSSGRYPTTEAVLKVITALGLRTRKGRHCVNAIVCSATFKRNLFRVGGKRKRSCTGNHEAIISDELFSAVQAKLKSKTVPHRETE